MRLLSIALSALCITAFSAKGQKDLSVHLNTGLHVPFNDFSDNSFQGVKPNLFVSAGLGYYMFENLWLRADLSAGVLNGNNEVSFYETTLYETGLSAEYNILPYLGKKSKYQIRINAGAGLTSYYTKLYDLTTRDLITESPAPASSSLSINPYFAGGFSVNYPLTTNLAASVGYNQKLMLFNDFMDGFESGASNDFYGTLNVGIVVTFKDVKDKSKVEIDKKKYKKLISTIDSLDIAAKQGNPEKMARMEMESQEKDLKIRSLEMVVDSLKTNVVTVGTDKPKSARQADAEAILATSQYRIIVGSMPTRELATRFISRSSLDQSEMVVIYVDDIDTYRIIYKSFNTLAAAKKELPAARSVVSDAWIIKL